MSTSVNKLALFAVGTGLSFTAIQIPLVQAQTVCQSYRVTRPDGLYVYIQGGKRIITTLPHNYLVKVTGLSAGRTWARIQYLRRDGLLGQGWVSAKYLSCFQR